jgi:4-hydroxy-3-methylbut-2-enyl diphosphate reductase IspH
MNRVAKELRGIVARLKKYVHFEFKDIDQKRADFVNAICSNIDDLADRIRRNEGLEMKVVRRSDGDHVTVQVLMDDHEEAKAIREELVERVSTLSKKKKLNVRVD